jgi:hypothetical protein
MESEGRRRWRWRESDLHLVCPDAHSSGLAIESGPGWTLRPGLNYRLLVGREIERGRDQTVGGCSLSAVRVRAGQRDDNQLDSALLLLVSIIRSLCRVREGALASTDESTTGLPSETPNSDDGPSGLLRQHPMADLKRKREQGESLRLTGYCPSKLNCIESGLGRKAGTRTRCCPTSVAWWTSWTS